MAPGHAQAQKDLIALESHWSQTGFSTASMELCTMEVRLPSSVQCLCSTTTDIIIGNCDDTYGNVDQPGGYNHSQCMFFGLILSDQYHDAEALRC
jgi:hypothetical protein